MRSTCGECRSTSCTPLTPVDAASLRDDIPAFRPGDTVKVHVNVVEGERKRVQVFPGCGDPSAGGVRGVVHRPQGQFRGGCRAHVPRAQPIIDHIEMVSRGDVRRAKLYYLRELRGKAAKIREKRDNTSRDQKPPPPAAALVPALWRFVKIVIILVVALGLSFLVRTFVVQAFYVPSQSMENTLMPNDRILASKLSTRFGGVDRGQIVVFRDPGNWLDDAQKRSPGGLPGLFEWIGLLPSNTGDDLVKRVIGVGETMCAAAAPTAGSCSTVCL